MKSDFGQQQHQDPLIPFEIRALHERELKTHQNLTALDMDSEDIDQALAGGGKAFAALEGQSIASFLWIFPIPPGLNDDLTLEFDEPLAYVYKAFTLPEFRGHGLMPAVLGAALRDCTALAYPGVVACIDSANRPSWRAFRSAGFKTFATIRFAKVFGRYWIQPRLSRTTPRFRVKKVR